METWLKGIGEASGRNQMQKILSSEHKRVSAEPALISEFGTPSCCLTCVHVVTILGKSHPTQGSKSYSSGGDFEHTNRT